MHKHPTLDNLYLGNINPNEDLKPAFPEYKKTADEAYDLECRLEAKLAAADLELFRAMLDARGGAYSMEVREAFICGFRLGANIMLEVLGAYKPNEL